jgi:hypothetical protein
MIRLRKKNSEYLFLSQLKEWYHVIIAIDDHQINAYLKKKDGTLDDLLSTRVNRDPKMARGGVLITPKGG